ncbi:MAG: adenylate/guanylate cyclase domain-containing protein [Elusimicrobia bacterium]|nr:MAG: adenylate/guanylate cyclase domain-containing protein [Elusimicrobiota bacterium]
MRTRHLTILLTDIKGFTSRTASGSRSDMVALLRKHKELVLPALEKFRGTLVKTIGDAFLVTFDSPTDAVLCGVEIQEILKEHNSEKTGRERIEIRIAINSGEVAVAEDGDIFGDAVNITARLESIAEPGEVFFTEAVYLAMNKREVPSSEIGYRQFKGIPERIKVFRVLRETPVGSQGVAPARDDQAAEAPGETPAAARAPAQRAGFWRRTAALLLDALLFAMIIGTLGIRACGPAASVSSEESKDLPTAMELENIRINKEGIEISGRDGGGVTIKKHGAAVLGPDGRVWRSKKHVNVGAGNDRSRVPVAMLLWALYGGLLVWRFGATPGKKIMGIKVVDNETGGRVGADKAFLRAFFSLASLFLMLGYIWAAWQKEGRTWHDIIAGTRAIKI